MSYLSPRLRPCFETLENRLVPAGNVKVFFDKFGDLIIKGDNAANAINIAQDITGPGSIGIQAEPGTQLNGVDGGAFTGTIRRHVRVIMKGGDDDVEIFGDMVFKKNLAVDMGTGNNGFKANGGNLFVGGNFNILNQGQNGQSQGSV